MAIIQEWIALNGTRVIIDDECIFAKAVMRDGVLTFERVVNPRATSAPAQRDRQDGAGAKA